MARKSIAPPKVNLGQSLKRIRSWFAREWRALRQPAATWVTGIDIDGDEARMAQIRFKGKTRELRWIGTVPLTDPQTGAPNPAARETIRKWGVAQGRIVTFLPRDQAAVKQMVLPAGESAELRQMARYEASQLLPRPPEELLADVEVISREADGSSRVLLVAATQQQVETYLRVLDDLGLEPQKIELSTTALARVLGDAAGEEQISLCHIGRRRADILVRSGAETVFSRGIDLSPIGDDDQMLAEEILRSVRYGQKGKSEDAGRVSLCLLADHGRGADLESRLGDSVNLVQHAFPSTFAVNGVKEDLAPYAAAIGAALDSGTGINLLPATLVRRREIRRQLRSGAVTALLAVAFVVLGASLVDRYLASAERELEQTRAEMDKMRPEVRDLRRLQQREAAISSHLDPSSDALEVYTELFRIAPAGATISHLRLTRGQIVLKGQAHDYPGVWKLVEALSGSPMFTAARLQFATSRQVRGTPVVDFNIEAELVKKGAS